MGMGNGKAAGEGVANRRNESNPIQSYQNLHIVDRLAVGKA